MFTSPALKACALTAALATATLIGTAASAVTVDLATGGNVTGTGQHVATFASGGVSGSITAGCGYVSSDPNCSNSGPTSTPKVQIGVLGAGVSSFMDVSNQLDTSNDGEFLTFTFDTAVTLLSINFGAFDVSDAYDLLVNGVLVASASTTDPWTTNLYNVTSFTVASVNMSSTDHGFTVKSFNAAPVPLPAAGLLLLGGLSALGAARRRKAAQA